MNVSYKRMRYAMLTAMCAGIFLGFQSQAMFRSAARTFVPAIRSSMPRVAQSVTHATVGARVVPARLQPVIFYGVRNFGTSAIGNETIAPKQRKKAVKEPKAKKAKKQKLNMDAQVAAMAAQTPVGEYLVTQSVPVEVQPDIVDNAQAATTVEASECVVVDSTAVDIQPKAMSDETRQALTDAFLREREEAARLLAMSPHQDQVPSEQTVTQQEQEVAKPKSKTAQLLALIGFTVGASYFGTSYAINKATRTEVKKPVQKTWRNGWGLFS